VPDHKVPFCGLHLEEDLTPSHVRANIIGLQIDVDTAILSDAA
jgi:hypothetical protein